MNLPTPTQIEVATTVGGDLLETVNRWLGEGAEVQDILAALSKATADTIVMAYGPTMVAPYFSGMAVAAAEIPGAN